MERPRRRFRKNRLYQWVDPPHARPAGQASHKDGAESRRFQSGVLRAQDDGQIVVGRRIARIELDGLPVLDDRLPGLVLIAQGSA